MYYVLIAKITHIHMYIYTTIYLTITKVNHTLENK